MKKINIQKLIYRIKHQYFQLDNIVIIVALIVAASWTMSAIDVMQRNYSLQKQYDAKVRQKKLLELENYSLEYEGRYYKSREYLELQARDVLGLARPGEHVLILPKNSVAAKNSDNSIQGRQATAGTLPPSNMEQWMNFMFGGNSRDLR